MSYVNYTDGQKEQAVQTDMIDFLGKEYGYSFKKAGHEYHCEEHNSLVVNQNRCRWYWNSQKIGGNNAIDWLMKIENKSYPEAMNKLVGRGMGESKPAKYSKAAPSPSEEKRELKLPQPTAGAYKNVFAYLCKSRNIDSNIVMELVNKKHIYQDNRNNAVFVGYDENRSPKFACVRGTMSDVQYRGDCTGSNKTYPFGYVGSQNSELFIFESPIDLMSHATMFNKISGNQEAWKAHSRISLSGTSDVALEGFLSRHKEVKNIYICLDNDEAGSRASSNIAEKYAAKGYKTQILPPKSKDYNEDLTVYISSQKDTQCIQKSKSL